MNSDKIELNLPFAGFYYSLYGDELDQELEMFVEYQREELELSIEEAQGLGDILICNTNWTAAHVEIAMRYVDAFNELFEEWTGIKLNLTYRTMLSPKYYNFETDRIFAWADESAILQLRINVDNKRLQEVIRERFTSCDGFISHYPNYLPDWNENVLEWDHNELCTLVMAFLPKDWEMDVYYRTFYSDEAGRAFDKAVDWGAVNEYLGNVIE